MEDNTFTGSQFKVALQIVSDGFNMDEDDWTCKVRNGVREVLRTKTQGCIRHDDGTWFVKIDTAELGSGRYELIVDIDVPDSDFNGMRHETYKINLIPVYPV